MIRFFFLSFLLTLIACSCSQRTFHGKLIDSTTEAREGSRNFVVTAAGKKIYGSDVRKIRRKGNAVIVVDDVEYKFMDIAVMQTDEGFYLKRNHHFMYRISRGKLEAYCLTLSDGDRNSTSCYLTTDRINFYDYTKQNLYELIKADPAAVALFNLTYDNTRSSTPMDFQYQKVIAVLKLFNKAK
ncbi:MAG: hypothetical protein IPP72_00980 [Chitinophagaceae bacterium]|nr:hypothetical protein [Chitinophagaceae bacterium]